MQLSKIKNPPFIVFHFNGRLDSTTSSQVEKTLLSAIEEGEKHVILDFSDLEYLSSAGIRILVQCHKKITALKGQICLVSIPKSIENLLHITGFLPYFQTFENQSTAIEKLILAGS